MNMTEIVTIIPTQQGIYFGWLPANHALGSEQVHRMEMTWTDIDTALVCVPSRISGRKENTWTMERTR